MRDGVDDLAVLGDAVKTIFITEAPDDFSTVVAVQIQDVMQKCDAKDAEMFALNVGWVRSTGKRIITGYWIQKPD